LLDEIGARAPHPPVEIRLLVPFGREDVTARLYREAEVLSKEMDTDGTIVRARVGLRLLSAIRGFVLEDA
jgi:GTP-binding protein HflX